MWCYTICIDPLSTHKLGILSSCLEHYQVAKPASVLAGCSICISSPQHLYMRSITSLREVYIYHLPTVVPQQPTVSVPAGHNICSCNRQHLSKQPTTFCLKATVLEAYSIHSSTKKPHHQSQQPTASVQAAHSFCTTRPNYLHKQLTTPDHMSVSQNTCQVVLRMCHRNPHHLSQQTVIPVLKGNSICTCSQQHHQKWLAAPI